MNCTINIKSELSWPFVLYQFCREQYQVMCSRLYILRTIVRGQQMKCIITQALIS